MPAMTIRAFLAALLAALLTLAAARGASAAAQRPPNVVVFLADDLGQRDLASYGSTFHETPATDRLARQGMRFTDAYAACPVCSPTRAALLTGRYPQRFAATDYFGAPQPAQWKRNTRLLPAAYSDRLPLEEVTLAEALRSAGYATFFAGKWHLGPRGFWPEDQGFDVNMGGIDQGGPYGGKKYFSPYANPRLPDGPDGEHLPDRLATEAVRFIEAHREKPFLVYFSFYDVHTPLMARADLKAKYDRKAAALPEAAGPKFLPEGPRMARQVQDHAVYAGMVEAMDQAVGKVLDALDRLDLARDTVVIFTSDNGGLSTSEGSPTSNVPWRGGKGWMYEGGIRVPLIVRYPPRVKPGSTSAEPAISVDLLPTLLELCSVPPPGGARPLDGVSLVPALSQSGPVPRDALYWHYPHYGNQGGAPTSAVRAGDWKLIEWLEDGKLELFNLKEDPSERTDLAAREPGRVRALHEKLRAWRTATGARLPTPNAAFDPAKPDGRAPPAPARAPATRPAPRPASRR